jgi:hypothetical protein
LFPGGSSQEMVYVSSFIVKIKCANISQWVSLSLKSFVEECGSDEAVLLKTSLEGTIKIKHNKFDFFSRS